MSAAMSARRLFKCDSVTLASASQLVGVGAAQEVELVQFMGKDNVPFHTIIFPATLLGTGQPWTMMRNISVTEYLNYEGGKFSKSRGIGALPTSVA